MKKIFGIIVMVMFIVMMNVGLADNFDNGCDCPYCSGNRIVREWCIENEFENHVNDITIGDTHFYTGALVKNEWEEHYGEKFTFEGWINKSSEEFDVGWMDIDQVGEINGVPVYRMSAVGKDGKNIKNELSKIVDVIFVIK